MIEKLHQKRSERTQLPTTRYTLRPRIYPKSYRTQAARTLLAQHIFTLPHINHIYDDSGKHLTIDKLLNGSQSQIWAKSLSMELGRLAHGNKYGVDFTDTIAFISLEDVLEGGK